MRSETIARANARLVDYYASLPLARAWGGGEVASADGMRFTVPVRNVYAGYNGRYFGNERGTRAAWFVRLRIWKWRVYRPRPRRHRAAGNGHINFLGR